MAKFPTEKQIKKFKRKYPHFLGKDGNLIPSVVEFLEKVDKEYGLKNWDKYRDEIKKRIDNNDF